MTLDLIFKTVSLPKREGFPKRNEKILRRFDEGEERKALYFLRDFKPQKNKTYCLYRSDMPRGISLVLAQLPEETSFR